MDLIKNFLLKLKIYFNQELFLKYEKSNDKRIKRRFKILFLLL